VEDVEEETVFIAPKEPAYLQQAPEMTTVKVRNLVGKYTLDRLVTELQEFKMEFNFVRFFPRSGSVRAYAFVDFASPKLADAFLASIEAVHGQKGNTLATGNLPKRDALPSKLQGEKALIKAYRKLAGAAANTWTA